MTNGARRSLGPVRHKFGTVRQKHVSASCAGAPESPTRPKTGTDRERTTTMTRFSAWRAGGLVVVCAFVCAATAQTRSTDMSQAARVIPSGLGDAVDRDVAKV